MSALGDYLIWNGTEYECPYGDGRTLYVKADAWAEAQLERAQELLAEQYPDLSQQALEDLLDAETLIPEADICLNKAHNELIDPFPWLSCAIEVDHDGFPLNPEEGTSNDLSAWIQ